MSMENPHPYKRRRAESQRQELSRLRRKKEAIEYAGSELKHALEGTSFGWTGFINAAVAAITFDIEEELNEDPAYQAEQETQALRERVIFLESQIAIQSAAEVIASVDQIPKWPGGWTKHPDAGWIPNAADPRPAGSPTGAGFFPGSIGELSADVPRPVEPPRDEHGRCSACQGTGYVNGNATRAWYCTCPVGIDLRRIDRRDTQQEPAT